MSDAILSERRGAVGLVTLNRPDRLNAWDTPMRHALIAALERLGAEAAVRAVVLTGAGERAFGAGQDLRETMGFDADGAEAWAAEWGRFYGAARALEKPLVVALNGVAAGSAFQLALHADFRIGHPGVRMGQPEIDNGIASATGPWIMREMLGLARTVDLVLTGRLMDAQECLATGILNRLVPRERVLDEALALADGLAAKPPVAMRLDKRRFREMTEAGFREAVAAGARLQRESYASGEPTRMMAAFFAARADRRG